MADGKGTITGMIRSAESTPKVYTNHANHPGHTTATFNKQKSPLNSTTRQGSDPTQGMTRQGSTPNTDPEFLKDPLTKLWN